MRSARDSCLRSVRVFGIGVIIPSSFTKLYALPKSPMFARMRTEDATTFTATVCSCTRIPSPTLSIPEHHLKSPQYGLSKILATLHRGNARRCVFARRETSTASAMSTAWYIHPPQSRSESSCRWFAPYCAHYRNGMGIMFRSSAGSSTIVG